MRCGVFVGSTGTPRWYRARQGVCMIENCATATSEEEKKTLPFAAVSFKVQVALPVERPPTQLRGPSPSRQESTDTGQAPPTSHETRSAAHHFQHSKLQAAGARRAVKPCPVRLLVLTHCRMPQIESQDGRYDFANECQILVLHPDHDLSTARGYPSRDCLANWLCLARGQSASELHPDLGLLATCRDSGLAEETSQCFAECARRLVAREHRQSP